MYIVCPLVLTGGIEDQLLDELAHGPALLREVLRDLDAGLSHVEILPSIFPDCVKSLVHAGVLLFPLLPILPPYLPLSASPGGFS